MRARFAHFKGNVDVLQAYNLSGSLYTEYYSIHVSRSRLEQFKSIHDINYAKSE